MRDAFAAPSLARRSEEMEEAETKRNFDDTLSYVFLLRFPATAAIALLFLPAAGKWIPGLLRLSAGSIPIVTALALLIAWTCLFCGLTLIDGASARLPDFEPRLPQWLFRLRFPLSSIFALPVVIAVLSPICGESRAWLTAAAGLSGAVLVLGLALASFRLIDTRSAIRLRLRRVLHGVIGANSDAASLSSSRPAFLLIAFVTLSAAGLLVSWRVVWNLEHNRPADLLPALAYLEILLLQWTVLLTHRFTFPGSPAGVGVARSACVATGSSLHRGRWALFPDQARCPDTPYLTATTC